tara:strand:- start:48077 stop:48286 length:210 start_codon:yes stop_codon:yes gene_type:complete
MLGTVIRFGIVFGLGVLIGRAYEQDKQDQFEVEKAQPESSPESSKEEAKEETKEESSTPETDDTKESGE